MYFYLNSLTNRNITQITSQGEAFLAENQQKPGVITTASGLQYQYLTRGEGTQHPAASDTVKVHYEGRLLDGSVFDSSIKRGEPLAFPLNRVIKGWTEGVQLMVEGDKVRFFIPNNLAYGNRSAGQIPPGSALIFDIELLKINP
ncbi:FKBP-type peptidyl-prolyl cis-trans isomerase [Shewanella sp. YIC-542]|uniref:FKBP-type peptidyl-prolyl cis-trans isomerase n=1 Tax=Shewanella mytili TaxID=3377111 RepID=UPI00398EE324